MITRPKTGGASEVRRCWLLQMSKCHDAVSHSTLSSEFCSRGLSCVFIRAELSGWLQRLWARSVVFPLYWRGLGHVWWLIEHETLRHSARKPWNCQPSLLECSRVVTDSGGQTDDLTVPCWQPVVKHSVVLDILGFFFLWEIQLSCLLNYKHWWKKYSDPWSKSPNTTLWKYSTSSKSPTFKTLSKVLIIISIKYSILNIESKSTDDVFWIIWMLHFTAVIA